MRCVGWGGREQEGLVRGGTVDGRDGGGREQEGWDGWEWS